MCGSEVLFLNLMLCLNYLPLIESAKILAIYPTPSYSHQVVFRSLTLELVKLGHNVTVITTNPIFEKGKAPENLNEIDVSFSYKKMEKFLNATKGVSGEIDDQIRILTKVMTNTIEDQLKSKDIQELIETEKHFDLLIVEAYFRMCWVLGHVYNAPLVFFNSFGGSIDLYNSVGAVHHPLLYPLPGASKIYNLTLAEKIKQIYLEKKYDDLFNSGEKDDEKTVKTIFPQATTFRDLIKRVGIFLPNLNRMWEGNRPVPPNVLHVGGIHQNPVAELPRDLKSYLDNSTNGVIYFSLGINVKISLIAPEKVKMLLRVLSATPYNVLLKWDGNGLPVHAKNIKVGEWFPQGDVLRHKNVKLFITQCGQQSTDEAIANEVPMIAIPLVIDQYHTAEKIAHYGIGVKVDLVSVTEDEFRNSVHAVIGNESYRNNIANLRALMTDQPQTPLQRAIWWIEYVLRNGTKHLRAPAANLTWCQYYEIELVVLVLSTILCAVILLVWLVLKLVKLIWRIDVVVYKKNV